MLFIDELKKYFPDNQLIINHQDKQPYETDWRGRYSVQALAVVLPKSVVEISWIIECCQRHNIKIVPQSGNTSLCGGSVPTNNNTSIIVNLSKLNKIRALDLSNNTITVESGVILQDLANVATENNRYFPLSMASEGSAQIGGVISTNAGGTSVIRYGSMRSQILGLEVVLPDATVWHGLTGLRKDNTGYDLKQLFIGAEGTLGFITAAVLKLYPKPTQREIYWLTASSLENTITTLNNLRSSIGDCISAFEIISKPCIDLLKQYFANLNVPNLDDHNWAILLELEYFEQHYDIDELILTCLNQGIIHNAIKAHNEEQKSHFWRLREHIPLAEKLDGFSIKHDISLPISAIPEFVDTCVKEVSQIIPGSKSICFGHLGDGNLHFNFTKPANMDQTDFLGMSKEVNKIVYDLVYQYQGSLSAEHGIGQLKVNVLSQYKSEVEIHLMKSIKQTLDPQNMMNPGKILDL